MKKLFILVLSLLLLSSCSDDNIDSSLVFYETDNFSINIPSNWEKVSNIEDILPNPSYGNIELAAVSKNTISWFANNIVILSTELNKMTTSKDYSILNNIWAEKDYIDYLKLSSNDITFPDSDSSTLYEFEAKYNYDTEKYKFLQTAKICKNVQAYLITIAVPTNVKDISRYSDFISSFKCK